MPQAGAGAAAHGVVVDRVAAQAALEVLRGIHAVAALSRQDLTDYPCTAGTAPQADKSAADILGRAHGVIARNPDRGIDRDQERIVARGVVHAADAERVSAAAR